MIAYILYAIMIPLSMYKIKDSVRKSFYCET